MTFSVRLHPNARRHRDRIILWFADNYPEHIDPFLDDFYATARFVGEHPTLRAEKRPGVRHESMRTYQYTCGTARSRSCSSSRSSPYSTTAAIHSRSKGD